MSQLKEFRREKDAFFASDPQSPLTPEQQRAFKGLSYFAENPELHLETNVERFTSHEEVTMQTSTGSLQPYVKYGRIHFSVDGQDAQLTIYSSEEETTIRLRETPLPGKKVFQISP